MSFNTAHASTFFRGEIFPSIYTSHKLFIFILPLLTGLWVGCFWKIVLMILFFRSSQSSYFFLNWEGFLVVVVHNENPDNSIFQSFCYWFMRTIFDIVTLLYSGGPSKGRATKAPRPTKYLSNLAGHWKNMLIIALKNNALQKVASKFSEWRE